MDFGDIGGNLPIIVVIIGLILLQIFLIRRRKPETTHRAIVQSLLSEVRLNQALVEAAYLQQKPRKFAVTSWHMNKRKLDSLQQSLQGSLSEAFGMAEDFNQQIEAAKKYKSAAYMAGVNMDKLKEPLAESRQGLEEWLQLKTGTKEPSLEYPGLFDSLFGKR